MPSIRSFRGIHDLDVVLRVTNAESRALVGGRDMGGTAYFTYDNGRLSTTFEIPANERTVSAELAREIVDWRIAEYLDRPAPSAGD